MQVKSFNNVDISAVFVQVFLKIKNLDSVDIDMLFILFLGNFCCSKNVMVLFLSLTVFTF